MFVYIDACMYIFALDDVFIYVYIYIYICTTISEYVFSDVNIDIVDVDM